jgi:hypothetical protein
VHFCIGFPWFLPTKEIGLTPKSGAAVGPYSHDTANMTARYYGLASNQIGEIPYYLLVNIDSKDTTQNILQGQKREPWMELCAQDAEEQDPVRNCLDSSRR